MKKSSLNAVDRLNDLITLLRLNREHHNPSHNPDLMSQYFSLLQSFAHKKIPKKLLSTIDIFIKSEVESLLMSKQAELDKITRTMNSLDKSALKAALLTQETYQLLKDTNQNLYSVEAHLIKIEDVISKPRQQYIIAGEKVFNELNKFEINSREKIIVLVTQIRGIEKNANLSHDEKEFLIKLFREVFMNEDTMQINDFRDALSELIFQKTGHILGFEFNRETDIHPDLNNQGNRNPHDIDLSLETVELEDSVDDHREKYSGLEELQSLAKDLDFPLEYSEPTHPIANKTGYQSGYEDELSEAAESSDDETESLLQDRSEDSGFEDDEPINIEEIVKQLEDLPISKEDRATIIRELEESLEPLAQKAAKEFPTELEALDFNDFDLEPLTQKMPKEPPTELNPLELNVEEDDPLADLRQGAEGLILPEENEDLPIIPTAFTANTGALNKKSEVKNSEASRKNEENVESDDDSKPKL